MLIGLGSVSIAFESGREVGDGGVEFAHGRVALAAECHDPRRALVAPL